MTVYFEDVAVGDTFEFGTYEVTEEEILEFAERYDPQWFHTDPERAREESMYGGLIASGWHTTAMMMRLFVEGHLHEAATLGAKGVDELRWRRPVRPGDVLTARAEVLSKEAEGPERGLVRVGLETLTGHGDGDGDGGGDVVCSMVGLMLYARRSA